MTRASTLFTTLLMLAALLLPGAAAAADISGTYRGDFKYYDAKRQEVTGGFTIHIRQAGQHISGTIDEPRSDFGPKDAATLQSDFSGAVWPAGGSLEVVFVKTYRYDNHTVLYDGNYDAQSGQIAGTWRIGDYKGPFTIRGVRPRP